MSLKTILVADDDPDVRLSLNVRLKANGYNVIFASDGLTCIEEAQKHVLAAIAQCRHIRANVFADKELAYLAESDAPGVLKYCRGLEAALKEANVSYLPHEQIIDKLDESARLFRILLIKTDMTIPYTSVFFQLDCGYWNTDAEHRLRKALSAASE